MNSGRTCGISGRYSMKRFLAFFCLVSLLTILFGSDAVPALTATGISYNLTPLGKKKVAKKKTDMKKFEKEILPAYEKYVRENFSKAVADDTPYSFIYLNNDNIPELVVEGGFSAAGCLVCTYNKGVVALNTDRLMLGYVEKKNILHNPFAYMGYFSDDVYSIKKGEFVKVWSGYYEDNMDEKSPIEYTYYYKGSVISEKKYKAKLKRALGNNSKTTGKFIKGSTIKEAYKKFKKAKGL